MTESLDQIMDFDHVIKVNADKTVTDELPNVRENWAPELLDGKLMSEDWSLMDGYSLQSGYSGPIMHPSEFIGGQMERDILETPGLYVAIVAYNSNGDEPDGWAVAYRKVG